MLPKPHSEGFNGQPRAPTTSTAEVQKDSANKAQGVAHPPLTTKQKGEAVDILGCACLALREAKEPEENERAEKAASGSSGPLVRALARS